MPPGTPEFVSGLSRFLANLYKGSDTVTEIVPAGRAFRGPKRYLTRAGPTAMAGAIEFGYNAPTFASAPGPRNPGPNDFDTPFYEALEWADVRETIQAADDLGFDAVWAPDHFMLGVDHAILECWTLLSWAAARTDLRVGPLVACNDYRNPALLAKMAATLDIVSDGRLTLGLGAGWFEEEYEAYGWPFRDGFTRLLRLDEAIQVVRTMWTEDEPAFQGDHYAIEDAYCEPGPVQDPHPPIMVGGGGEDVTLKLVAKRADAWNFGGTLDGYAGKVDVLEDHCETVGRDPDEIELTYDGRVICTRDREHLDRLLSRTGPDDVTSREDLEEADEVATIVGTPEECAEQLEPFVDLGVTRFQFWFVDAPERAGMALFADEVIPQFR